MSVFMDLNITAGTDKAKLQSTIETAAHLGYSTVAINYVVEGQKKKQLIPTPQPLAELFETFPTVQGKSRPIKVLNRLTVVATDASHFRPTNEYKNFDLLAVHPKTDKLFHAACMNYDVDIICISATEPQSFHFKRSPVNGAIERGVFFEISYSAGIRDPTMKKYTITNAVNLISVCKGKVIGLIFGLSEGDSKAAVSTNCRSVVLHGETRGTALGIIHTMKRPQLPTEQPEEEIPAAKKAKTDDGSLIV
uniref:Ribonuclease P/MRP subunit p30 n=1 Tax=Astyanax mexicanus TaxID=7994 RepID=A0A3B1JX47_ASTMX